MGQGKENLSVKLHEIAQAQTKEKVKHARKEGHLDTQGRFTALLNLLLYALLSIYVFYLLG